MSTIQCPAPTYEKYGKRDPRRSEDGQTEVPIQRGRHQCPTRYHMGLQFLGETLRRERLHDGALRQNQSGSVLP
jgi:hypothetical protein